jgi:tagatose 1,6-diphosphate aldolase GatY/KbaY
MLAQTKTLVERARRERWAVAGFNVYNLEGIKAVILAGEEARAPLLLQIHPGALKHGGPPLIHLALAAAQAAATPVAVHLDHSASEQDIRMALEAGVSSVMADGSELPYEKNLEFCKRMSESIHARGAIMEAELGRLAGTEDDLTVEQYDECLTDPKQAPAFVVAAGADMLAICIGNVHGHSKKPPQLDFERLAEIQNAVSVPIVLHGASGLPDAMIRRSIELGVSKFNVNTELRDAYKEALRSVFSMPKPAREPDLVEILSDAVERMKDVAIRKLRLFGAEGKG